MLEGRSKDNANEVGKTVKRELLRAERAAQRGRYDKAEKSCHRALGLLMNSEHAEQRAYLEARAVTMDKVQYVIL